MSATKKHIPYDRWIWLDLEMTGLDVDRCHILQAAMIITDPDLNELAQEDIVIWQPESVISSMIPFVREMHTTNGLIKKVRSSQVSVEEAEAKLLQVLTQHVGYQRGVLAGNSIYMDRLFLRRYMPTFASYLHYRQIDVSSIKILCQEWYKAKPPKKPSSHTALEDIRDSLDELKFYKANFIRPM